MNKLALDTLQIGLDDKVKQICNNIESNVELEASFGSSKRPISLKKFHNLLKYIKVKSKNNKLINEQKHRPNQQYNEFEGTTQTKP